MADSPFEISVDSDWKQQAREEKRKLAEEAARKSEAAKPAPAAAPTAKGQAAPRARGTADFKGLVRSISETVLMYLGAVPVGADGRGMLDLDEAKRQIDLLAVLEDKTTGNLGADEQASLDVALYESRTRYASVAQRYIL